MNKCPECESKLVHDSLNNEYTCQGCGYLILAAEDNFVVGAEEDHSFQAVGYSELDKSNISIGYHAENRKGRKGAYNAKNEIKSLSSSMFLPRKVREHAIMIYLNFQKVSSGKGRPAISVAAAAIYLACKRFSIPYSLKEVVRSIGLKKEENADRYLKFAYKYCRLMIFTDSTVVDDIVNVEDENNNGHSILGSSWKNEPESPPSKRCFICYTGLPILHLWPD